MAVVNHTTHGADHIPVSAQAQQPGCEIIEYDFVKHPMASADLALLRKFSKREHIDSVGVEVLEQPDAAINVDVGLYTTADTPIAVDADGFLDGADLNVAAATVYSSRNATISGEGAVTPAYGLGVRPTADNWLTMLANAAVSTGKIRITVNFTRVCG